MDTGIGIGSLQPQRPEVINADGTISRLYNTGDVPSEKLCPCCGLCFIWASFYMEAPHFLGCASRIVICCHNWEQINCKIARKPNTTGSCCVTNLTKCDLFWPPALVKLLCQVCCCDIRFALPCDQDVPFLFNICGCTMFYKDCSYMGACCLNVDALNRKKSGL